MILPETLFAPPIAHRGLWRPGGAPENSLAAVEAAVAAGYGVEFDVRLTGDGVPVVFHDEDLQRMCGRPERVDALTLDELRLIPLGGTAQAIPTLAEVLAVCAGAPMILVELKKSFPEGVLEPKVAALLDTYEGEHVVISFMADMLAWFAEHRPDMLRGLDATGASDAQIAASEFALEHIFDGQFDLADPQVLVLSRDMAGGKVATRYRDRGYPVVVWTIRAPDELAPISKAIDNYIFEGFTP